jgi:hypothetical protein
LDASLDKLILENLEDLIDRITKDAVRFIPSYRDAPLRTTAKRVEVWLRVLATSLQENDPQILEKYLVTIANERYAEGYQVTELHDIVQLTDQHLRDYIELTAIEPTERNALTALCEAVMDAARMVVSVTYVLITAGKA